MNVLLISLLLAGAPEASLYELSTAASTASLKAGESGKVAFAFTLKEGSHLSDDAPMKIELKSEKLVLEKSLLKRSDEVKRANSVANTAPAHTAVFEAPFKATEKGSHTVEAKLTFFVCTDKECVRQQKNVSVPVSVQ